MLAMASSLYSRIRTKMGQFQRARKQKTHAWQFGDEVNIIVLEDAETKGAESIIRRNLCAILQCDCYARTWPWYWSNSRIKTKLIWLEKCLCLLLDERLKATLVDAEKVILRKSPLIGIKSKVVVLASWKTHMCLFKSKCFLYVPKTLL